jgi:hypothetical protein
MGRVIFYVKLGNELLADNLTCIHIDHFLGHVPHNIIGDLLRGLIIHLVLGGVQRKVFVVLVVGDHFHNEIWNDFVLEKGLVGGRNLVYTSSHSLTFRTT